MHPGGMNGPHPFRRAAAEHLKSRNATQQLVFKIIQARATDNAALKAVEGRQTSGDRLFAAGLVQTAVIVLKLRGHDELQIADVVPQVTFDTAVIRAWTRL